MFTRRIARTLLLAAVMLLAFTLSGSAAVIGKAELVVTIDVSDQTMRVVTPNGTLPAWRVSTARAPYTTPTGTFRPQRLERMWYSRKYDNAPMPYAIFYHHGYAIHGTTDLKRLGTPASHGCVRLHPDNARTLFHLVLAYGRNNTVIRVQR